MHQSTQFPLPVIDLGHLIRDPDSEQAKQTIEQIGSACRRFGFFYISNHGIPKLLQLGLKESAKEFFGLSSEQKAQISMARGGKAWRGFFPVGGEVTSGVPDQKEGIYFGTELPASDLRPMHGPNLFPTQPSNMRALVLEYMERCGALGHTLLAAIAASLGLKPDHFGSQFQNPLALFRIFNYPVHDVKFGANSFGVGEHTDYGYLTLLLQDQCGGLEVKIAKGAWVDAPPIPNTLVVNLGDALQHNTGGLLQATPHRVRQRSTAGDQSAGDRLSFPFFFDPSFDSPMQSVVPYLPRDLQQQIQQKQGGSSGGSNSGSLRWDGQQPELYNGKYGEYVLAKVSKVFPQLAAAAL